MGSKLTWDVASDFLTNSIVVRMSLRDEASDRCLSLQGTCPTYMLTDSAGPYLEDTIQRMVRDILTEAKSYGIDTTTVK